jgi:hypothetical protein
MDMDRYREGDKSAHGESTGSPSDGFTSSPHKSDGNPNINMDSTLSLKDMSVAQLKELCRQSSVSIVGCLDREDLINRIEESSSRRSESYSSSSSSSNSNSSSSSNINSKIAHSRLGNPCSPLLLRSEMPLPLPLLLLVGKGHRGDSSNTRHVQKCNACQFQRALGKGRPMLYSRCHKIFRQLKGQPRRQRAGQP